MRSDAIKRSSPICLFPTVLIDPRNGLPVYYSESRAKRPHTYGTEPEDCPICRGNITRILDLSPLPSPLPDEFCFINKNLYPLAFPQEGSGWGLHFLIWPSNYHGRDFRNMELPAVSEVLRRIAVLERKLLLEGEAHAAEAQLMEQDAKKGRVCLIKNEGAPVGGSVAHDHFQLLYTFSEPLRFRQDRLFSEEHGMSFSAWLSAAEGFGFEILKTESWFVTVPYFMRRPYDIFIIQRDDEKKYLCDLDTHDIDELASLLRTTFRASDELFSRLGRNPAFNLITHNSGHGALYFEFLPYTQERGGFEQLGLYLSQTAPGTAAGFYRSFFGNSL